MLLENDVICMLCVPHFKVINRTDEIGIALQEESGLQVFRARGRKRLSAQFFDCASVLHGQADSFRIFRLTATDFTV
jgi:hypothetical protein